MSTEAQGTAFIGVETYPAGTSLSQGKYILKSLIGIGGMGAVYLAVQTSIDRNVAVKLIHPNLVRSTSVRQRFHREVKVMSKLSSAHCITIFDFGETDDGILFLVMEYLEGRTLAEVLATDGRLPIPVFNEWFIQICRGVENAHVLGIVHRDLKPENILIQSTPNGERIKVLDFGIAKIIEGHPTTDQMTLSQTGAIVGTPQYMSPEQAKGEPCDLRTDIFSLGLIAYECLTGKAAFSGNTPLAVMHAITTNMPREILHERPELSVGIQSIIESAIAKSPENRIQNVSTLRIALEAEQSALSSLPDDNEAARSSAGDWRNLTNTNGVSATADKTNPDETVLKAVREKHRHADLRAFLKVVTSWMAVPLFLVFWIADLIYAPQHKWLFLSIRLGVVGAGIYLNHSIGRITSLRNLEIAGGGYIALNALAITFMIFIAEGPQSPYYAGLNLVAIGSLTFLPWTRGAMISNAILIYGPYLGYSAFILTHDTATTFAINAFFIGATLVISLVVRNETEKLRTLEIAGSARLQLELAQRDKVISDKTSELIKFRELSNQFSPQVIDAIRMGAIKLGSQPTQKRICAVFVDIHGFGERVSRLEHDKVQASINRFLKDASSTFMRHGVTIDRFLGHGLTGFTNAPIERDDYVSSAIQAANALQREVEKSRSFYLDHWLNHFSLRIAVVSGPAAVGFFGHQANFRHYSAMGRSVELAAQIAKLAQPGHVLFSGDTSKVEPLSTITIRDIGRHVIPGHGDDLIRLFEVEPVTSTPDDTMTLDTSDASESS